MEVDSHPRSSPNEKEAGASLKSYVVYFPCLVCWLLLVLFLKLAMKLDPKNAYLPWIWAGYTLKKTGAADFLISVSERSADERD